MHDMHNFAGSFVKIAFRGILISRLEHNCEFRGILISRSWENIENYLQYTPLIGLCLENLCVLTKQTIFEAF